jgi:hypothetical protein
MLVGSMLQISTQMGLHCVLDAQDFVKVPLQLDVSERSEWAQTWEACNIVAIRLVLALSTFPFSMQLSFTTY